MPLKTLRASSIGRIARTDHPAADPRAERLEIQL